VLVDPLPEFEEIEAKVVENKLLEYEVGKGSGKFIFRPLQTRQFWKCPSACGA
jgi:hypothetical protein